MTRLLRAAILMAASSAAGVVLNFAIQAYLAFAFGAGTDMDAYVAAMTLPALFMAVVVPSISMVVVPVLVQTRESRGVAATSRTAFTFVAFAAIVLAFVTIATTLAAGPLMRLVVPGLDGRTMTTALVLFRWLVPATALHGVTAALGAIYQSEDRFGATAIAPLAGSATLLVAALALASRIGIEGVAIATLLGNAMQVLLLLPVLRRRGFLTLDWNDAGVRRIVRLIAPLLGGGMIFRATVVADRIAASLLPKGSLAHIEYASRIAGVVSMLFAAGAATALYPRMAREAASSDRGQLARTFFTAQRMLMLVLFPALAIGWAVRKPLLTLLLERGHFTAADTDAVAALITWFFLGVIGAALGVLQGRIYYVLGDTLTPTFLGIIETAAYFAYLPLLTRSFAAAGVGMANAIYLLSALVVNGLIVIRKLGVLRNATDYLRAGTTIGITSAIAGGVAWWAMRAAHTPSTMFITGLAAGSATYFAMTIARAGDRRQLTIVLKAAMRRDSARDGAAI
jgi:putative peptidoglycan lipid II flippase